MLDAVRHAVLKGSPYQGYLYAYPHKTAYRTFAEPRALADLWRDEDKSALALYIHVPFCEMRCGFCNLFTATGADSDKIRAYLAALKAEAVAAGEALGAFRFARAAIGGGTPTFLEARELATLFDILETLTLGRVPVAVETSPSRTTPDRLAVMKERGVRRVSIGVESFDQTDLKAMGRPARATDATEALSSLREAAFANLNIDLIYGAEGQTPQRFLESIERALEWRPEEIYLYPLYVRHLTGLERRNAPGEDRQAWDAQRLILYRESRDRLLAAGYRQRSMRHFTRTLSETDAQDYSCQDDGMLGLGPGARSYTTSVHYATRYAVSRAGVWDIIDRHCATTNFSKATHGIELAEDDRRRRFIIKSLLQTDGLDLDRFRETFGMEAADTFTELPALVNLGLAVRTGQTLRLTAAGLERSDAIGPLLVSPSTRARMERYEWH